MIKVLKEALWLLETGNSPEGMINWLIPELEDPEGTFCRLEARYRTDKQGGYTLVGQWVDADGFEVQHMDPTPQPTTEPPPVPTKAEAFVRIPKDDPFRLQGGPEWTNPDVDRMGGGS